VTRSADAALDAEALSWGLGLSSAMGRESIDRSAGERLSRAFPVCLAIVLGVLAVAEALALSRMPVGQLLGGVDITGYVSATNRWWSTGTPYLANEVAGPFMFTTGTFLHPPLALYLFLPFTVLPLVAWWLIPIGVVTVSIAAWRPDRMWVTAFVALALRFGWPGLLIAIKPSFAFLMLVGSTSRSWWLGLWIVAIAAVPLGQLWLDWIAVVRHAPAGLDYSLTSIPMVLLPFVAWLRRTRHREAAGGWTTRTWRRLPNALPMLAGDRVAVVAEDDR
jgi:hypothetical protein